MRDEQINDDGRTIADMSAIERPRLLLPGRRGRNRDVDLDKGTVDSDKGTVDSSRLCLDESTVPLSKSTVPLDESMSKEERRAYIFGAMGAALVIGLIFLAAAAVVILLMILAWT